MTNIPPNSSEWPPPCVPSVVARRIAGATRQERQGAEILSAISQGRTRHALDLAFEHLEEFGPDQSVIQMLASAVVNRHDPALSNEFEALLRRIGLKPDSHNARG